MTFLGFPTIDLPRDGVPSSARVDVRDYTLGGETDFTAAIQRAIDAAEAAYDAGTVAVLNRLSSGPSVYLPAGLYPISGTLYIRRPIRLYGEGMHASVVRSTADAPLVEVELSVLRQYAAVAIEHLALCGPVAGSATPDALTNQHGIRLRHDPVGQDCTLAVLACNIQGCGGHGIYAPDNSNTLRVLWSTIQANWLDGIHLSGSFNTNSRITHNIIRENRRGLFLDGTGADGYLYSGHIAFNLFESNSNGTGQVGSVTRPARGIEAYNARQLFIQSNYFEGHLNHVVLNACAYLTVMHNQFFGASDVPGRFPGFGGPASRVGDVIVLGSSVAVACLDNIASAPAKPASTSDADWNTAAWGATYEMFPDFEGTQHTVVHRLGDPITFRGGAGTGDTRAQWGRDGLSLGSSGNTTALLMHGSTPGLGAGQYRAIVSQLTRDDATATAGLRFYRGADGVSGSVRVVTMDAFGTIAERAAFNGDSSIDLTTSIGVRVNGNKVLGGREAAVADPAGGATVDAQARTAIAGILAALRGHGMIST